VIVLVCGLLSAAVKLRLTGVTIGMAPFAKIRVGQFSTEGIVPP
jgi:hypothetical protein